MTPERRDDLLAKLLDGSFEEAELRELQDEAAADPEFTRRMAELLAVEPLLSDALAGDESGEGFARRILSEIRRPGDMAKFSKAIVEKLGRRRRPRRFASQQPPAWAAWIAAAAAVILLAGLAAALSNRGSKPAAPKTDNVAAADEREDAKPAGEEAVVKPPRPGPSESRPAAPAERPSLPGEAMPEPRPPKEESSPEPHPPTPKPVETHPAEDSRPPTRAALAVVAAVEGDVRIVEGENRSPAAAGAAIAEGHGLETCGIGSSASTLWPDGTRIDIEGETLVKSLSLSPGKRIEIDRGTFRAEVTRQPQGRPLTIATPHAEASVLGTRLAVMVSGDSTRLEVTEGRVRLRRRSDGKTVDVAAGHYAVVAAGREMAARPIPVDEILLLPQHGRAAAGDWKVVRDDAAVSGQALELARARTISAGRVDIRRRQEFVEFSFTADADRDYWIWVRGRCTAASDRPLHDAVAVEAFNANFSRPTHWRELAAQGAYPFNGYGKYRGYIWAGGDLDEPPEGTGPKSSVAIRFLRSGGQTIRLHAIETPMRVDAIWLSTTRNTPPEPGCKGPGR